MIRDLPRPLPECGRCQAPMPRTAFVESGGVCTGCMTVTEAVQRVHNRHRLARVVQAADRRAQARIDALATKRLSARSGAA